MLLPCGCRACGCTCGSLPYTMTVEFSNLVNKTHSGHCVLDFYANFGGGAAGVVLSPGGCDDNEPDCGASNRGGITSVLLLDGGCGYAKYARIEPTLTITGSGTGATFTPTLAADDSSGCNVWSIESVSVSDGAGYTDGEYLTIKAAAGVTIVEEAKLQLFVVGGRQEPTITASVAGGTGASLAVNVVDNKTGTPTSWGVGSVTVIDGGTGYTDGTPVTFDTPHYENEESTATIRTGRDEPTVTVSIVPPGGTGAVIEATLGPTTLNDGDAWEVTGFTIASGGSGYSVDDELWANVAEGDTAENYEPDFFALGFVTSVDGAGAITGVTLDGSGKGYATNSTIESVVVTDPGEYWDDSGEGVPDSVTVVEGGGYYAEDKTATGCVADITVTPCGGGSGAEIRAVVGDDPTDEATWGRVTELVIDAAGAGYLAWNWICLPHEELNGTPIVLRASAPRKLVTLSLDSCFGEGACVEVVPQGERLEPTLEPNAVHSSDAGGPTHEVATVTIALAQAGSGVGAYWYVSSVTASGGTDYPDVWDGLSFNLGCATQEEAAVIRLTASGGVVTGGEVLEGGKYFVQLEWDGTPGPIKAVQVVGGGGSGYARLGRETPTISIGQPSSAASGATFTPTLVEQSDDCGLPYWEIESIAIGGSGTGYVDGSTWTGNAASPNVAEVLASGRIYTRQQPTITATAGGFGSGAVLAVTLAESAGQPTKWSVASVSVTSGGSGYTATTPVSFAGSVGDFINQEPAVSVSVDEDGAITSVAVSYGGIMYRDVGAPQSVTIERKGRYYRENPALTPYVSTPTVLINQHPDSTGSGGVVVVVVEDDTSDPDFGKVVSASVASGGSSYTFLGGPTDCLYTGGCGKCDVDDPVVTLTTRGGETARVTLTDGRNPCEYPTHHSVYASDDLVSDCEALPESADLVYGAPAGSVTITRGGEWDSRGVQDCATKCDECACPDFDSLCVTFDFTDYFGNNFTWTNADNPPEEIADCIGIGVGCVECGSSGRPAVWIAASYNRLNCDNALDAGEDGCFCSTGYGQAGRSCDDTDPDWYLGTYTVPMAWVGCTPINPECPDPPASLTVTIAEGPCP